MDREACCATVHRVAKSQTWLSSLAHLLILHRCHNGVHPSAQGGIQIGSWWGASVGSSGRWYKGTGIFARWIRSSVQVDWWIYGDIGEDHHQWGQVGWEPWPGVWETYLMGAGWIKKVGDGLIFSLTEMTQSLNLLKEIINVFDWKGRWFGNSC